MRWLLKTEPGTYSFEDLVRDGSTFWDGVNNPVAVKNLASMKKGEALVVYHTGDVKAAVGTASVAGEPRPDPKNPKSWGVDVKAGAALRAPKTLAEIKASPLFRDSPLVKIGRLSVVPLTDDQHAFLTGR